MTAQVPRAVLVGLILCNWALVLGVFWTAEHPAARLLALAVGMLCTVLAAYDRGVWRWPGVRLLLRCPDAEGTWVGEIRSGWIDPRTGEKQPPLPAAMILRQSACDIVASQFTASSSSVTVTATLSEDRDGRWTIVGLYRNEPRLPHQDFSRIHHGGLRLVVTDGPTRRLSGDYWTDRGTRGELDLRFVARARAQSFDGALELAAAHAVPVPPPPPPYVATPQPTPLAPKPPTIDRTPFQNALAQLLLDVFDEHEMRAFAARTSAELSVQLPGSGVSVATLAHNLAALLVRMNDVTRALELLEQTRPNCRPTIDTLRHLHAAFLPPS